jgi:predicted dehydrogenase
LILPAFGSSLTHLLLPNPACHQSTASLPPSPPHPVNPAPLSIAILGCGSRGQTYASIAASFPEQFVITAAADPIPARRAKVAALAAPQAPTFSSAAELLTQPPLADLLIIATQDADHMPHATAALHAGYHLLLEKPAAASLEDCTELDRLARSLGRRVALCFVLRYTPFYQAVRTLLDSGRLGRIITMRLAEGVEPFHQAHSFVRGHWRSTASSTPMIVAKCSHDADLICWLANSRPRSVSSFGRLDWFHSSNSPATAPPRCTDGCDVPHCPYDARRYLSDKRRWLNMVMDGADSADDATITRFLESSPWGRCAFQCDNDVVDHQVVAAEMENGITATLTMTAFDHGRQIEIHGTLGSLRGGSPLHEAGTPELWFRDHHSATIEPIPIPQIEAPGYAGHGGGDAGLILSLPSLFRGPSALPPGLDGLHGHQLAFLAEHSRLSHASSQSPS